MARNPVLSAVQKIRRVLETLSPAIGFRKLNGILNALEMQVEDGNYQRHAVTRLCEAFLATCELHTIPQEVLDQFEELARAVVSLVEDRR